MNVSRFNSTMLKISRFLLPIEMVSNTRCDKINKNKTLNRF